jgi:hypothetical protein
MTTLREKIIAALYAEHGYRGLEDERAADRIIALPEIAVGEKVRDLVGRYLPPDTDMSEHDFANAVIGLMD